MSEISVQATSQDNFASNSVSTTVGSPLVKKTTVSTKSGAVTYTAAELLGGLILHDCGGTGDIDATLPTAATLVAAINNCAVGSSFEVIIRNTSGAVETLTLVQDAGPSFTVSGTATVGQNNSKKFLVVVTNVTSGAEKAVAYSLGTVIY